MTEPVSSSLPPNPEPISELSATLTVEAKVPIATQEVVLVVDSHILTELTFPMPTPDELASFICTRYIILKLPENKSFILCR